MNQLRERAAHGKQVVYTPNGLETAKAAIDDLNKIQRYMKSVSCGYGSFLPHKKAPSRHESA